MRRDEAILLYALLKGYKINVGKIIEKSVLSYSGRNYRGLIPYPATITSLCLLGGVEAEWEKEETYSRASPLTLTGVTNGPKNKGKGKEKEMEEERGSERCHEPAQWESSSQRQQELQRSLIPILNAPLDLRQNHQEQVGSSGQQCNNAELMEVLKSLKHEIKKGTTTSSSNYYSGMSTWRRSSEERTIIWRML